MQNNENTTDDTERNGETRVDKICDQVDEACKQLDNHNDGGAVEILTRLHHLLLARLDELSPITDQDRDLYDSSLNLYNAVVSTLQKANSWQNEKQQKTGQHS